MIKVTTKEQAKMLARAYEAAFLDLNVKCPGGINIVSTKLDYDVASKVYTAVVVGTDERGMHYNSMYAIAEVVWENTGALVYQPHNTSYFPTTGTTVRKVDEDVGDTGIEQLTKEEKVKESDRIWDAVRGVAGR